MQRRPRAVSWQVAFGLFFTVLAVGVGVGYLVWKRFVHYERIAALHVPVDSDAAARIDVEQGVVFEPVRRELLPLIDQLGAPAADAPRRKRIQNKTKLELAIDLREIVVATGPQADDWVVVLSGLFSRANVVGGIAEVLEEDGIRGQLHDGDTRWCREGLCIGQAPDGVLILASGPGRLAAARERSPEGLGRNLTGAALTAAASPRGVQRLVRVGLLPDGVERLEGTGRLDEGLHLSLRAWPSSGREGPLDEAFRARLQRAPKYAKFSGVSGLAEALEGARVESESAGSVRVQVEADRELFGAVLARVASEVRARAGSVKAATNPP